MSFSFRWCVLTICIFLCSKNLTYAETKIYNPIWLDSILESKVDSSAYANLLANTQITTAKEVNFFPQKLRDKTTQYISQVIAFGILLFLGFLSFFFGDYIITIRNSILNTAKYNLFFTTRKFDNLFVNLFFTLIKIVVLSCIIEISVQYFSNKNVSFHFLNYLRTLYTVSIFFIAKIAAENTFIWLIEKGKIYNFLNTFKLYYDLFFGLFLVFASVILLFNNVDILLYFFIIAASIYLIVLLYKFIQLQKFIKIPQKIYFVLYICTFKILPLLLLIKYLF